MKIMLETTEWPEGSGDCNHIYVFEEFKGCGRSAKAVAYVPHGVDPVQKFRTPLDIDLRGRTFVEVK
jgi:hypothetical protein